MSDAAPLLELDSIDAGYPGRPVLCGVSIQVLRGTLLGVLGPNGSGKSTLLRVAAGLLAPAAGTVRVRGDDIASLPRREVARRIAVLPQETSPAFDVTALAAVLLGRRPHASGLAFASGDDVEIAESALRATNAHGLRDRSFRTLSGGERQRVLLARAVAQGGDVLLCDEPTAHLDLRHQDETFALLRRLADEGRAVIVVTHDLELSASACDRVLLLSGAGAPAFGSPRDVLSADAIRRVFGVERDVHPGPAGLAISRHRS